MSNIEVDENELAALRRVSGFVKTALGNPETRRTILETQKKLNPGVSIPEIDAMGPVNETLAEVRKELKAAQDARALDKSEREARGVQDNAQREWNKGRKALRAGGWNDEGVRVIEDFMEKRGIADHEIAAAAYEKMHPATEAPIGSGPMRFDFFSAKTNSDMLKPLFEGRDEEFLRNMIPQALAEVRSPAR